MVMMKKAPCYRKKVLFIVGEKMVETTLHNVTEGNDD